jgi:hypothetical protein
MRYTTGNGNGYIGAKLRGSFAVLLNMKSLTLVRLENGTEISLSLLMQQLLLLLLLLLSLLLLLLFVLVVDFLCKWLSI